MNSIDKTNDGNYLFSGRGTNTVYLISEQDGSILWRLRGEGSPSSNFTLQGFNFSAQHDARRLHFDDSVITILSFLDNASDGYEISSPTSAGLVVAINHTDHTASLASRLPRPDGKISDRRGNVQALPNGRYVVCWSESGWISEFDGEGRNIIEALFKGRTLYTYRAYKVASAALNGIVPAEAPAIKAFAVIGRGRDTVVTSAYVS